MNIKKFLKTCFLVAGLSSLGAAAHADVPNNPMAGGLASVAKPRLEALERALAQNPALNQQIQMYRTNAKQIMTDNKLTLKDRAARINDLNSRNRALVAALFAKAQIDENAYQSEALAAAKRVEALTGHQYNLTYLGFLGWKWKAKAKIQSTARKHADKEIVLQPPFQDAQEQRNGGGTIETNKTRGTYSVTAQAAFAGGFENSAGLASFYILDDTYREVDVSAALPEAHWFVSAFADLGVATASAKSRIQIFNNNRVICDQEVEHASVFAPLFWIAQEEGTDNVVAVCGIPAPHARDEIVIRATSVTAVFAAAGGFAFASVNAAPRDLRLQLKF